MSRLWILGAADPEMEAIEKLLAGAGEAFIYATSSGGRVHPANAYQADPIDLDPEVCEIYLVECQVAVVLPITVVDHHRPGDLGFGLPPEEFLAASSIGQVLRALGIEATKDHLLTAAADHCLGAAYRGECPGVDPDELMRWRAEGRAKFQGRSVDELLADVEQTMRALFKARQIVLAPRSGHCGVGNCGCGDGSYGSGDPNASTRRGNGDCYCDCVDCRDATEAVVVYDMCREPPWPELPEAATRCGLGYISGPLIGPDGKKKYTCSGSFDQVEAFMKYWAPTNGLVGIYGDPARGFAGGYDENSTPIHL